MTLRRSSPFAVGAQSLWADSVPSVPRRAALPGDVTADVAIVGAGYTGLWTAHYLKAVDPHLRIVVIDAAQAGFGASGRNGGWCSAIAPMDLDVVEKQHGMTAARAMQHAMFETVREVERTCGTLGIDADIARGGYLHLARNAAQLERARAEVAAVHRLGFSDDDSRVLTANETRLMANATRVVGAAFTPHCAAVNPAKLARGLADAVEQAGVSIYEGTRATAIETRRVVTDHGTIRADVIVRATEAYTALLPEARREIVPLYSLMIATEPLDATTWADIGLATRPTFNDARNLIIYGQRTADGRLAFGGRGAPYHFRSAVSADYDRHHATHAGLRDILVDLFPVLQTTEITHAWGGPLALPRDWYPSVRFDRSTGMASAGGYVGDGVSTANLAGRTLTDLITGTDSHLTRLPWVDHRSPWWEPEPIRWIGVRGLSKLPGRVDRAEDRGKRSWTRPVLDRFV